MKKGNKYLVWGSAETLEEAENEIAIWYWKYAWDIETPKPIIELTLEDIAQWKGVDVSQIRIKD